MWWYGNKELSKQEEEEYGDCGVLYLIAGVSEE